MILSQKYHDIGDDRLSFWILYKQYWSCKLSESLKPYFLKHQIKLRNIVNIHLADLPLTSQPSHHQIPKNLLMPNNLFHLIRSKSTLKSIFSRTSKTCKIHTTASSKQIPIPPSPNHPRFMPTLAFALTNSYPSQLDLHAQNPIVKLAFPRLLWEKQLIKFQHLEAKIEFSRIDLERGSGREEEGQGGQRLEWGCWRIIKIATAFRFIPRFSGKTQWILD